MAHITYDTSKVLLRLTRDSNAAKKFPPNAAEPLLQRKDVQQRWLACSKWVWCCSDDAARQGGRGGECCDWMEFFGVYTPNLCNLPAASVPPAAWARLYQRMAADLLLRTPRPCS